MSVVFRESSERALMSRLDIGLISLRDRACLRLLYRAGVATAQQLATLVYPSRRTALRRLRRLWQLGLLERAPLAPERGGIPVAYRITRRGSKRLGYTDTRTGGVSRVRHSLDIAESVCALVRCVPGAVQLWLTEPMTDGLLPADVRPDSIVVLSVDGGSAVLCLEVDEATEHAPMIRARLDAYARALVDRPGWQLLWVVPTEERLAWLRRVARWEVRPGLEQCSWGVVLDDLRAIGLRAPTSPVGWSGEVVPLAAIASDSRPRGCPTPVGSSGWIRVLGTGGAEETEEALR
jgi:Replication-relaxation